MTDVVEATVRDARAARVTVSQPVLFFAPMDFQGGHDPKLPRAARVTYVHPDGAVMLAVDYLPDDINLHVAAPAGMRRIPVFAGTADGSPIKPPKGVHSWAQTMPAVAADGSPEGGVVAVNAMDKARRALEVAEQTAAKMREMDPAQLHQLAEAGLNKIDKLQASASKEFEAVSAEFKKRCDALESDIAAVAKRVAAVEVAGQDGEKKKTTKASA